MISLQTLRSMFARLPGVVEASSYGTPGFKLKKKLLARMHQKEDAIVVLLESVDEQQSLIRDDPMVYFITDHYEGYAAVLVRPIVDEEALFALLERGWRRAASKSAIADYDSRSGAR